MDCKAKPRAGSLWVCEKCHQERVERQEKGAARALAILERDYPRAGHFCQLQKLTVDDHNRHAFDELDGYGPDWKLGDGDYNLFLHGPPGTGKTTLAYAVARAHVVDYHSFGEAARFVNIRELLAAARNAMTRGDRSNPIEELFVDEFCDDGEGPGLIVLDDLGAERPTEWARETIAGIVERAYTLRIPLVITSNFSPAQLVKRLSGADQADPIAGQRIVSRLRENCLVLKLGGPDRRVTDVQLQAIA